MLHLEEYICVALLHRAHWLGWSPAALELRLQIYRTLSNCTSRLTHYRSSLCLSFEIESLSSSLDSRTKNTRHHDSHQLPLPHPSQATINGDILLPYMHLRIQEEGCRPSDQVQNADGVRANSSHEINDTPELSAGLSALGLPTWLK